MTKLIVFTDGASRGNPGRAAIGAALYAEDGGDVVGTVSEDIGTATNNVAEYKAVIAGLEGKKPSGWGRPRSSCGPTACCWCAS